MRLGRFQRGAEAIFAVSQSDDAWMPFPVLGVESRDTQEAIAVLGEVSGSLVRAEPQPLASLGTIVCPIVRPGKVLAIGLNYMDHIRETGAEAPERPIVFAKYSSSLNDPNAAIEVDPQLTQQADYESELAVVIGREARRVSRAEALSYVFGYLVANDVSARDWQRQDSQFSRSKSFDTFCPMGPWITAASEVNDPHNLQIRSVARPITTRGGRPCRSRACRRHGTADARVHYLSTITRQTSRDLLGRAGTAWDVTSW